MWNTVTLKAGSIPPYGMPTPNGPGDIPELREPDWLLNAPKDGSWPPPLPDISGQLSIAVRGGDVTLSEQPCTCFTGSVENNICSGIDYTSTAEKINGLCVYSGEYALKDGKMHMVGNGSNDFGGVGSAVMATGDSCVEMRNMHITTDGIIRPCTVSAGESCVKIYDSVLIGNGGTLPENYKPVIGMGMMEPPAGLGIGGNCRTHLSLGNSKTYFYDSVIAADGWAALSTDGCTDSLYLEANNCEVICRGVGYGTYSDGGCIVVLNDCNVTTATHTAIMAGDCDLEINRCNVRSGKYGVMLHTVMGSVTEIGRLKITGGKIRTKDAALFLKSTNAYICVDGAEIECEDGILIRSILNDDPHGTHVPADEPDVYGDKISLNNMTLHGDILCEDTERTMSVSMANVQLSGAVKNVYLSMDENSRWTATGDSFIVLVGKASASQFDAAAGVTVTAIPGEGCTLSGEYTLPSGGKLIIG